jgi:UDP-2-acetamido-2-deoxy-ribo-hexuluronate aminotransferase
MLSDGQESLFIPQICPHFLAKRMSLGLRGAGAVVLRDLPDYAAVRPVASTSNRRARSWPPNPKAKGKTMIVNADYDHGIIRLKAEFPVKEARFPVKVVVPEEFLVARAPGSSPPGLAFIDLKAQQEAILPVLMERIFGVLAHGQYILGPEVKELEERLAAYTGVKHVISCSSGTDALRLSLMAYGVGPGDAVFTTAFTFIAPAEVIQLLGATPVFVDIDPQTFNMDPEALREAIVGLGKIPATAHLRPRGIIPVDLFGQAADYDRINALAQSYGLFVLEDAAQAFGATYKGRRAGSLAEVAATSFFPAKPLGGYGDGGAIFTDDDALAAVLRSLRVHGHGTQRYYHVRLGLNGRLDTLQAAILLAKLEVFDQEVAARQQVARRYQEALAEVVRVPYVAPDCTSVWAQYSVLSEERERMQQKLTTAGVPTGIYYPLPLHLQSAFSHLGYKPGDFPVSEHTAARIFSLPMHPYLPEADQARIIQTFLS